MSAFQDLPGNMDAAEGPGRVSSTGEKSVNPVATQKKGRQGYDQANHAKSRRKQAEQVCNFS